MNAVEIEEAITELAERPFDPENFPYDFLEAFGNKDTTIKRLRAGASNKSDLGGVLQTNNIHIKVCAEGEVTKTLTALREAPSTARAKAKFILATDGHTLEAENLVSDDPPVACVYTDFPDHFGFFLPLAGITTVKQISENSFDIRATSRLNRLYVELLKDNPDWGSAERRHDMNHFMARLIFCFFAEDTDIFIGRRLFTDTVAQIRNDATFLLADVEVVATYELYNINRVKLENLIHRVFDPARLDIEVKDRFARSVIPREWFLVPLFVVNEVVERIKDGTITDYVYNPKAARLVKVGV